MVFQVKGCASAASIVSVAGCVPCPSEAPALPSGCACVLTANRPPITLTSIRAGAILLLSL